MTTLSDRRIDDLIAWHRERLACVMLEYYNSAVSRQPFYRKVADMHRDTAEALEELAEFRHEQEMAEDEDA